jgi:DNA topoisomerase-2
MADQRKEWLQQYDPLVCINHNKKTIGYKEFIDKELIHFSIADNVRSIPNMVDGMKPS